jgi:hypothetical protein
MIGRHKCNDQDELDDMAEIWTRARVQAFAHQVAMERVQRKIRNLKIKEMAIAVSVIALLVIGYTLGLGLPQNVNFEKSQGLDSYIALASHLFLFTSTLVGIYGLYFVVTSERDELIELKTRHRELSHLFLTISGKTRCIVADIYDDGFYKFNIAFLNDLLPVLQVRETPSDEDFKIAHERLAALIENPRKEIAASFAPDSLRTPEQPSCDDGSKEPKKPQRPSAPPKA